MFICCVQEPLDILYVFPFPYPCFRCVKDASGDQVRLEFLFGWQLAIEGSLVILWNYLPRRNPALAH